MGLGSGIGNIGNLMKMKSAWETFTRNHPRFPGFLDAVRRKGVSEGDIIAFSITDTNGQKTETNIRVTASDLELFEALRQMK